MLSAVLLVAGCTESGPREAYRQYLTRLARTLSVTPVAATAAATPILPPPRELRLDLVSSKLDALDFLALSGCAVQITIGKRNSSLGRLARPSQRLLLELEYLRLAPECIVYQRQRGETALAATLQEAWDLKRRQLPARVFNATLGGAEYRQFWQAPPLSGDYPANTGSALITALERVNEVVGRWLGGDFTADNQGFELLLGKVASGDGGALLQALAIQGGALAAADRTLAARMERGPLCAPSLRPAAADILTNVVRKYFVSGIQPRAAALNGRYHALLPPVVALEQILDAALPPAYLDWQAQRNRVLTDLTQAPRRHVQNLLAIQQPCAPEAAAAEA